MGFNYAKFEEDLFQEVMKHMETQLDKKEDLYAFSLDYYPQVTVSIGFWANTCSYLKECMERNSEYYLDYKYNEQEWGIVERFDSLSLNATIWEYFSDEEMLQTYEEINGKENAAEYRKFLFGE